MSDTPKDDSWWQGVDGKWYPPVAKAATTEGLNVNSSAPEVKQNKFSRKKVGLIASAAVAGLLLVLLFLQIREPSIERVTGTFTLVGSWSVYSGYSLDKNCNASGGYSDIGSSTQVILKNKEGLEVTRTDLGMFPIIDLSGDRRCTWTFRLDVPEGEEYYVLSVGRRGEMKFSFEEMKSISLTLGGD